MLLIPLTDEMSAEACAEFILLLESLGIPHELRRGAGGNSLWVRPEDHGRAVHELRAYLRENQRPPEPPVVWPEHPHPWLGVFGYALVLIAVALAVLARAGGYNWEARGMLDAGFLARGEGWRAITALTLHGDFPHLLSNLGFGALFGYPAARLFGPGVAWLLILAGGGVAYSLDALLHPPNHRLLGASTAVFTALGLITSYGWRRHLRRWSPLVRRSAPLVAGIALLAFTGTGGEDTDVLAHLTGFIVGVATGAVCARLRLPLPGNARAQWIAGALALIMVAAAWIAALGGFHGGA